MIKSIELEVAGDPELDPGLTTALSELPGITEVESHGGRLLVRYDLRETNPAVIVELIEARGGVLSLTRRERLRLRARCYREAVHREDLNNEIGWDSFVREIYVSRYRHRRHGRRDDRPRHWRQYDTRD